MKSSFGPLRAPVRLVVLALALLADFRAVQAQTTIIGSTTLSSTSTLTIGAGNVTLSTGTLAMNANGTATYTAVLGAGTLQLGSTTNNATTYPDISFCPNDTANSTANWGVAIGTPVNLGALQRFIWGKTDHNSVDEYGLTGADCQLNGPISGSGGLTFIAQDAYTSSKPMETPFCLNAANTFTGPVQIQRGSVYLGAAGAFPAGNVLQFNVASGNNGKLFLYGQNTTVADLSSTGAGNAYVVNGNRNPSPIGPATLTIIQNNAETYAGTIVDTNAEYANTTVGAVTSLSLVKNGPATLTLTGTNRFSGTLTVNAGKLYLNTIASSIVGPVTVNSGGTLGGSGLVATNVTVANGGILEAGNGAGAGTLTLKSLTLGAVASDALTLNLSSTAAGLATTFAVTNFNGLINNGTTTINISGTLPAASPAVYTLVKYAGTLNGGGTFVLGTIPSFQTTAYLYNNPGAGALQLVIPGPSLTWAGSPTTDWSSAGHLDWVQTGTSTPAGYADGDTVVFDDTAANFSVNLAALVQPFSVVFNNAANNFTLNGAGVISNAFSVVKQGAAAVTLGGANLFLTNLTINAGSLYVNCTNTGGTVLVNNRGKLGGGGTIGSTVTVANGGGLVAGNGAGSGTLTLKSLTLGAVAGDALTLNLSGTGAGMATLFAVANASGVTNNGTTTINVSGTLPAANPAVYNLLTYSGTVKGSGTFVLGTVPTFQVSPYVTNNTTAATLQLVVPLQPLPAFVWVGSPTNDWDLAGNLDWVLTGSATPAAYADGSPVIFDDTAANFSVNLAATVQPYSVVFSNSVNNYLISGSGGISNSASLTKQGAATVTLATTNTYSGQTIIGAGTLALGAVGAIPSGPGAGNAVVNGTLDLAGFSPVVNNLSGTGTVDDVSAGGSPVLTVSNTANSSFSGSLQNSSGSVALTKTGAGTLTLGANNAYTGGTTIANGVVSITGGGGLGYGAVNVTENAAGGVSNFLTAATAAAVTLTNNLALPNDTGTYVLTKNETGRLTLGGILSGGGTGLILRTTTDTAGDTNTVFEFAGANTFTGGLQTYRGVVQVDNANSLSGATIYGDGNNSVAGDLSFANSMTFANPLALQSATSLSPNANTVVMSGPISGSANVTKFGSGTLVLAGANTFAGTLSNSVGTVVIGSVNLAGDTTGAPQIDLLGIAAGAVIQSSGTLAMDASSSLNPSICVNGAGTLLLTATTNSPSSPDLYFCASDVANSTANWGCRIATPLNLGAAQRYVWGNTEHSGVDKYGVTEADCQFAGTISGTGGLTFIAQDSYTGSSPMETPFCLNAANTFTGPVQIQRGSVFLGAAGAFPAGDTLQFNVAAGNNGKLFLWGQNATVANLSSTGAGTAYIADGDRNPSGVGPATLTILQNNPGTFAGSIVDTNLEYAGTTVGSSTVLSVVKSGPASLTLSGNNSFSGTLAVNAGKLYLNGTSTGGGLVTVSNNATLGGIGSLASLVIVSNGAALEAGGGAGLGTLALNQLALGVLATDAVTLNFDANPAGINTISVQTANGMTNLAVVTVNVTGVLPATVPAVYTLVSYAGTIQGSGSFVLGSVPDQAVAYLTNNAAAAALQLVVSSVTIPSVTWVASPTNDWDLLGSNIWKQTGTGLPATYADFDQVVFDDTAANFSVNLAAAVSPNGVLVTNNVNNYIIGGPGAISGFTSLTKAGTATVTLNTTNNYFGPTTISGGTLALGTVGAIPGGPGAGGVTVNGTLDVGGFSPTLNNLSGSGVVNNISAGGLPILTVSNSAASLFTGTIQNSSGTLELNQVGGGTLTLAGNNTFGGETIINGGMLQIGNGGMTGTLGAGLVLDTGTLAFNRSDTNTVANSIAGSGGLQQNGSGTVILAGNLTYSGPTVVNAGTLAFPKDVTFDASTGTTLAVAANAAVDTGFELFLNANATSVAVDVSGAGTVRLVGNVNYVEDWADIVFGENNNGITTANYGVAIASGLDLGTTNRLVWGISSRDDVAEFGLTGCDSQFNGPIYGTTAKLQLIGQNSWPGVHTMEDQFAFNASNSFTGTLEVTRGSVYVGNSNAFNGNVLILDPLPSVNSRFFLYGFNATVSDLQSGGFGAAVIANGNNVSSANVGPATLTVTENQPTTFAGNIVDWYTEYTAPATGAKIPTLSLVINGPAALTLTGTNTYSGTTVINSGQLNVVGSSTGGGAVTVNTNAALGGSGLLGSSVTVKKGGSIYVGVGGVGNFQVNSLALGAGTGDTAVLNLTPVALLNVTNNNGLVLNGGAGSVAVNIGGDIASTGVVPLISYAGTLGGSGFAGFQLGSLPPGILGYLSNDTAHALVDFVATQVIIPRWTGALNTDWGTTVLAAPKNWVLNSDGVTPIDYVDGENVRFDDTAVNPAVYINNAAVAPASVTLSNAVENYVISGSYGITGAGGLTKQGSGRVLLNSANSYAGNTVVTAGTLTLGSAGAVPGGAGAGNVTVNGTLDVAGLSPTLNNLSGTGVVDDLAAGGSPVVTVEETAASQFSGVLANTTGSLGLTLAGNGTLTLSGANTYSGPTLVGGGALLVNGSLGATAVTVQNGAALGGSGVILGSNTLSAGAALDLTANAPLTVGRLTINGAVTVNVSGTISVTTPATYVLLNYTNLNITNFFVLAPVPGVFNSSYNATLNATNNQLLLVVGPAKPTGTIADIRHIVFFTQENRSFDHYFGALHGVHGFGDHVTLTLTNGNSVLYQPNGASYELPFHTSILSIADLAHSWSDAHQEWDNGWHDQWVPAKSTESMAYYERSDIPYHYALADAYTVCDEFHCCALTSTDPNRLYVFSAMIDPNGIAGYPNAGPVTANTEPSTGWGTNWLTYAQVLQKAGVSWKVYQASDNYDDNALAWFYAFKNAATTSPLYQNGMADVANLTNGFAADVSNNVLPSVSWIVGPDYGSEHPSYEPGVGANILQNLINSLAANSNVYNSTVFIYNIDEGDGFFDHAVPINPPTGTSSEFVTGQPIGLGERVPCIIVSPWSRGGYVDSQVFDHTSVLRLIEKWTGVPVPNLSAWRRQVCGDLTSALDFAHPNYSYPSNFLNNAANTETVNYSTAGTTATPPGTQTVPVQEAGSLIARPLPYQPNAWAVLDPIQGNCDVLMTNSGAVSMHFAVYPNYASPILPTPFDVLPANSLIGAFSTQTSGHYDFSCYGPNGFLRRFAGNLKTDAGQLDSVALLNPCANGLEITLANSGGAPVVFSVTNGWFANSLNTYTVPANSTNLVFLDASTNNGWYDLTVTAASDSLFVRRFAGHIETNAIPAAFVSSENPSGFKDNVTFTANVTGFGTPSGAVQFRTNGVALGAPVPLNNGVATVATSLLPRANNVVTAEYSGDQFNLALTNSLIQTVTNHPPVAGLAFYTRPVGVKLLISVSQLLTNVTDVDGDTITLAGAGSDGFNMLTTNGVTLFSNGAYLLYTNSVTPNVNDSFLYTVTDGYGGTNTGTVTILVTGFATGQNNAQLNLSPTNVTATFFGVPGYQYIVQRSTNLAAGSWVNISTNIAPTNGVMQVLDGFQDLNISVPPLPPAVFYRLEYINP